MKVAQQDLTRLSVDIPSQLKRRLRVAAAHRDSTVRQYVIDMLKERLTMDLGPEPSETETSMLSAKSDPVLAALWDNDSDSAYDEL